jgi:DNA polymerase-3 subunit epsilon
MYTELRDLEKLADDTNDLDRIKQAVSNENFVILDTETTGLHDGEIIEIAIIDHLGNTLMNQRIKPHKGIPSESYAVHGISEDDVKDCPHFEDVVTLIKGHLAGKDVIVYNATYDRKMLHRSAEHAGIEKINWKAFSNWMCAMEAFSPIYGAWNQKYGNYRWQKLSTAAAYYEIAVENAHSALGDCLMTLVIVKAMAGQDTD